MKHYDIGDRVRITGTLTSPETGQPVDPTNLQITIRDPAGNTTTLQYGTDPEVVRDDTGIYHVDIDVTTRGQWHYRFAATGVNTAAAEGTFYANPSHF